jgi:hypothetical protein
MALINSNNHSQSKVKPLVSPAEMLEVEKKLVAPVAKVATETLGEIGRDFGKTFKKDLAGGIASDFIRQLLGQPIVTPEVIKQPTGEASAKKEALRWKKIAMQAEHNRREEKAVLVRKEQETAQRIMTVRRELQIQITSFSRDMVAWSRQVEIATFQAPVAPSIYDESFFEKLLSFVKKLRVSVQGSRHWLAAQNAKSSKKKGLWGMAKTKKGNTFNQEILFSGERAVSMSG